MITDFKLYENLSIFTRCFHDNNIKCIKEYIKKDNDYLYMIWNNQSLIEHSVYERKTDIFDLLLRNKIKLTDENIMYIFYQDIPYYLSELLKKDYINLNNNENNSSKSPLFVLSSDAGMDLYNNFTYFLKRNDLDLYATDMYGEDAMDNALESSIDYTIKILKKGYDFNKFYKKYKITLNQTVKDGIKLELEKYPKLYKQFQKLETISDFNI